MIMYINAEDIPSDISLPEEGWETVIWYRSWSDISDDVYYHLIRIFQITNIERESILQVHLQMFRNGRVRRYDISEEMTEQC